MTCTTIWRTAFEVIVGIRDCDLSVVSNDSKEKLWLGAIRCRAGNSWLRRFRRPPFHPFLPSVCSPWVEQMADLLSSRGLI